ncbi:fibroleukin-like [Calliphora vicina]|uniref:fibroleukin-like n=1 Tax=Calliphora vicina TaxID=7373 RepID=UPI00325B438E
MCATSEISDIDEKYLNLFDQIESVKNTIDILKVRLGAVSEKNSTDIYALIDSKFGIVKQSFDDINTRLDVLIDNSKIKQRDTDKQSIDDLKAELDSLTDNFKEMHIDLEEKYLELIKNKENDEDSRMYNLTAQILEKEAYDMKPLFDVRVDQLPAFKKEHCQPDSEPIDCKAATKCTQKSGYYKIYLAGNKEKQIMVFCDMEIGGGNWMHILRRIDGSENFTRPWSDYVNGFGKVEGEYWIGLDNLNALTNNNGRQQLYFHLEFDLESRYALYDNFLVGDASEIYKIKSVGTFNGTSGDGMADKLHKKFSTFDNDNDELDRNCAAEYGGWWHSHCEYAEATGDYEYSKSGSYSEGYKVDYYKTLYFMIRSS